MSLPVLMVVVVVAAITGDSVGYEVGKRYAHGLLALPIFARHQVAIEKGRIRLQTNGGPDILFSRFTAFLRAVMPGMAGLAHMPYRTFLAWNAVGGVMWGIGFSLLGYLAGASYKSIETFAGNLSYVVLALVAMGAAVLAFRHKRGDRDAESVPMGASATEPPLP